MHKNTQKFLQLFVFVQSLYGPILAMDCDDPYRGTGGNSSSGGNSSAVKHMDDTEENQKWASYIHPTKSELFKPSDDVMDKAINGDMASQLNVINWITAYYSEYMVPNFLPRGHKLSWEAWKSAVCEHRKQLIKNRPDLEGTPDWYHPPFTFAALQLGQDIFDEAFLTFLESTAESHSQNSAESRFLWAWVFDGRLEGKINPGFSAQQYEEAANAGYSLAWSNLGVMKYGEFLNEKNTQYETDEDYLDGLYTNGVENLIGSVMDEEDDFINSDDDMDMIQSEENQSEAAPSHQTSGAIEAIKTLYLKAIDKNAGLFAKENLIGLLVDEDIAMEGWHIDTVTNELIQKSKFGAYCSKYEDFMDKWDGEKSKNRKKNFWIDAEVALTKLKDLNCSQQVIEQLKENVVHMKGNEQKKEAKSNMGETVAHKSTDDWLGEMDDHIQILNYFNKMGYPLASKMLADLMIERDRLASPTKDINPENYPSCFKLYKGAYDLGVDDALSGFLQFKHLSKLPLTEEESQRLFKDLSNMYLDRISLTTEEREFLFNAYEKKMEDGLKKDSHECVYNACWYAYDLDLPGKGKDALVQKLKQLSNQFYEVGRLDVAQKYESWANHANNYLSDEDEMEDEADDQNN